VRARSVTAYYGPLIKGIVHAGWNPAGPFFWCSSNPQWPGFHVGGAGYLRRGFVTFAAQDDGEVLDIGCAFGVSSLAALNAGERVCACDMEPRHLDALLEHAPAYLRSKLRAVTWVLPQVQFAPHSFQAILASRVIHFLMRSDIRTSLNAMFEWFTPAGRLYLVADTPYMPGWNDIVPSYEAAKAAGEPWPGLIPDFARYATSNAAASGAPENPPRKELKWSRTNDCSLNRHSTIQRLDSPRQWA
jgi:SAM-dependent methyltransferase